MTTMQVTPSAAWLPTIREIPRDQHAIYAWCCLLPRGSACKVPTAKERARETLAGSWTGRQSLDPGQRGHSVGVCAHLFSLSEQRGKGADKLAKCPSRWPSTAPRALRLRETNICREQPRQEGPEEMGCKSYHPHRCFTRSGRRAEMGARCQPRALHEMREEIDEEQLGV